MAKYIPTQNPLANPQTPIHALAQLFQEHLHFPDPAPLYAVMGCYAANVLTGDPLWLMLVGPPGCGKTEILGSLLGTPGVHEAGSVTGPGSLLSGTGKKDRGKDATGGLLRQVGERGCLVFKDFTGILSLARDPLMGVLDGLRQVYDGYWNRPVGAEGGMVLSWQGRIALLAGCTPAIDGQMATMGEMGERFVLFRYPRADGWAESNKALDNIVPSTTRRELRELVTSFFESMELGWKQELARRYLEDQEKYRIIAMAQVAGKARSTVRRHSYTREVEDVAFSEFPTRLAKALGQMYVGLEYVGLEEDERWRVVGKCALDCLPVNRRMALVECARAWYGGMRLCGKDPKKWGWVPSGYVESTWLAEEVMRVSSGSVLRTVEDLEIHGLLECSVWRVDMETGEGSLVRVGSGRGDSDVGGSGSGGGQGGRGKGKGKGNGGGGGKASFRQSEGAGGAGGAGGESGINGKVQYFTLCKLSEWAVKECGKAWGRELDKWNAMVL